MSVIVTGADQFNLWIETKPVLSDRLVPVHEYRNHRGSRMQCETRQARRGTGRNAEEIDEHPFRDLRVLIRQNSDRALVSQNLQDRARRLIFIDRLVAVQAAV